MCCNIYLKGKQGDRRNKENLNIYRFELNNSKQSTPTMNKKKQQPKPTPTTKRKKQQTMQLTPTTRRRRNTNNKKHEKDRLWVTMCTNDVFFRVSLCFALFTALVAVDWPIMFLILQIISIFSVLFFFESFKIRKKIRTASQTISASEYVELYILLYLKRSEFCIEWRQIA